MAQAFVSTYRNHYRGIPEERVHSYPPDGFEKVLPDTDKNLWILVEEECDDSENLAKAYAKTKELQKKRNRSVYQVSYCTDPDQATKSIEDENLDNQIIQYCKILYGRRVDIMLPPLPSGRHVFGYIRRTRLITPLSVYQDAYGRLACNILEKNSGDS